MNTCSFSSEHYREIIERALAFGYRFYTFFEYIQGQIQEKNIILRHDVDVSLEKAAECAKIEKELSIPATYFVRLHSNFYSPLLFSQRKHLKKLCEGEAEIGLHYEADFYQSSGNNHIAMLKKDARMLSDVLERPVYGCSAHRPAVYPPLDMETVRSCGLYYEAYASEFTQDRKYISDSRCHWREGCLCRWLDKKEQLTVLIHPIWWFSDRKEVPGILKRISVGE